MRYFALAAALGLTLTTILGIVMTPPGLGIQT
jgi:hypothetical protein